MKALPVVLILVLLAACSAPAPTPDAPATEAAIAARIFATLTAAAPPPATPQPITATLSPTPIPPQPTATPSPTSSPAPTITPSPLPSPPPAPTDTPAPAATAGRPEAIVTGQSLNVRAGPGTMHPVIGVLRQGEAVQVTGRDAAGAWLEIRLVDGSSGWVSRSLVRTNPQSDAIAVAESIPTAPAPSPAATRAAPPANARRDLEVAYLNLHYECQRTEWQDRVRVWGYRSFQADLYIKNNSAEPVTPPWSPARWIITDGVNERASELIWEWGHVQTGLYDQPTIAPGQSAGWTFMAFPIERDEWVKAVEFEWQGQRYRVEFDLGPYGNAHNYRDCGDYPPAPWPRTPVPVETAVGPGSPNPGTTPVR